MKGGESVGKINVLSFEVANLIAAGEVVDRPASVIKELMENAIDSGADRITVEIQHGGVTFMSVSDNGCGMEADELPVAIRRHATSKIKDASDLEGICTLGFRGEALAAIASVSRLRIISKPKGASVGAMLEADCGNIVGVSERGASDGTRVIVEDLFANVPARRKFLKKDVTEAMAVTAYVEKIALSRPDSAFRLIVDGSQKIDTVGDGNLKNTIYSLFGRDFASKLLPADLTVDGIRVSGFIGRTDNVRANRNYQNFFINGRYIKSKTACAAIEQAYTSYIPPEKFPCCILRIDVNPAAVDVNVHPAKLEVKFSNERPVFEAIYYAVRNALEENVTRPSIDPRDLWKTDKRVSDMKAPISDTRGESLSRRQMSAELYTQQTQPLQASKEKTKEKTPEPPKKSGGFEHITAEQYVREYLSSGAKEQPVREDKNKMGAEREMPSCPIPASVAERTVVGSPKEAVREQPPRQINDSVAMQGTASSAVVPKDIPNKEKYETPEISEAPVENVAARGVRGATLAYRIVGEVFNSYVIVERGDVMLLIDKHAAHERIIFERLKESMRSLEPTSQLLMLPIEVMMTSEEIRTLGECAEDLKAIGFELETGKYTVSVTAIPEGIETDAIGDMLTVMAERIKENTGSARLTRDIIFEKALYQASCKAAIKAGREYAPEHIKWIVDKLMELPDITFCPHGRPVAMEISHKGLDKQFERC